MQLWWNCEGKDINPKGIMSFMTIYVLADWFARFWSHNPSPRLGVKMFEDKTTGMLQQNHSTRWLPVAPAIPWVYLLDFFEDLLLVALMMWETWLMPILQATWYFERYS